MGSVQGILEPFLLVPIWVSLPDLHAWNCLGQIQGNPVCCSPLGIFGNRNLWTFSPSSRHFLPYPGYCNIIIIYWIRKSTAWCSQPLNIVWSRAGKVSIFLSSVLLYCVQQLRFGGKIPPHSTLSIIHRSGLALWKWAMKIFCFLPFKRRPWPCGWLTGAHRLP